MFARIKEALFRPHKPTIIEQVDELKLQLEKRMLESQLTWCAGPVVDPNTPLYDDPDFYQAIGYGEAIPWNYDSRGRGEAIPIYLTEYGLKVIRDASRRACTESVFAINAIDNRISYSVGKGFQYEVIDRVRKAGKDKSDLAKQAQRVLDEFLNRSGWAEREQEAVLRCDRDGECFIRLFHVGDGKTEVRWIEPEHVRDATGQRHRQFGIVTDPDDLETRIAYSICEQPWLNLDTVDAPAEEVVHIKLNTDGSAKRGLPTLFPVSKNLIRAEKLLRNMSTLAQVQATFALIRKHKQYPASAISAFQQAQKDLTAQSPWTGKDVDLQRLRPGSIIDSTDQTEYEFPSVHVDASSLVALLQAELRAIAARLVMPEYMLSVDASNANYASTLVAEAPSTKNFERLQQHFARKFGDGQWCDSHHCSVLWRVLYYATEYGDLPREALTDLEIQAEGPVIVARDRDRESQRNKVLNEAGILSKHTWSKWEGLDRDQEEKLIALEKEREQPQAGGVTHDNADNGGDRLDFGEECLPNKKGPGHHDPDNKGKPCKPGGPEQPADEKETLADKLLAAQANIGNAKELAKFYLSLSAEDVNGLKKWWARATPKERADLLRDLWDAAASLGQLESILNSILHPLPKEEEPAKPPAPVSTPAEWKKWEEEARKAQAKRDAWAAKIRKEAKEDADLRKSIADKLLAQANKMRDERERGAIRRFFGADVHGKPSAEELLLREQSDQARNTKDFEIKDGKPVPITPAGKARQARFAEVQKIAGMSATQKLGAALGKIDRKMLGDVLFERVEELLKNLPVMAGSMAVLGAVSISPAGPFIMPLIGIIGYVMLGSTVIDISHDLYMFVTTALGATSDEDFKEAARHFARGMSKAAEGVALAAGTAVVAARLRAVAKAKKKAKVGEDGKVEVFPEGGAPEIAPKSRQRNGKRREYMGRNPEKGTPTYRDVVERMRGEGRIKTKNGVEKVLASDGTWIPLAEAELAHIHDAVKWWNEVGKYWGPKHTKVKEFMKDPKNYVLDKPGLNRSAGAKLKLEYDPPDPRPNGPPSPNPASP